MVAMAQAANGTVRLRNNGTVAVRIEVRSLIEAVAGQPADALRLRTPGPFRAFDAQARCSPNVGAGFGNVASVIPGARAVLTTFAVRGAAAAGELVATSRFTVPVVGYSAGGSAAGTAIVPVVNDRIEAYCTSGRPEFVMDVQAIFE